MPGGSAPAGSCGCCPCGRDVPGGRAPAGSFGGDPLPFPPTFEKHPNSRSRSFHEVQGGPTKRANFCLNRCSFTSSYWIKLKSDTHTRKT
jgi:hypothetical protein